MFLSTTIFNQIGEDFLLTDELIHTENFAPSFRFPEAVLHASVLLGRAHYRACRKKVNTFVKLFLQSL
ncbi:hypothetical protein BOV90_08675 [Solemya velum gill symbiont]|uniref:Uncharacterized protein n=1 Tax=Solemya velum gill symbiont TaxID=2340 RepID=A0A1T2DNW5_SOVGS|nr:hypothetical protein BOV88_00320 [Solemya velum gill symbiont]OOY38207.1 hypothetical protein BOV89_03760 [Solemya velum gill symbiont]OOY39539.1 hypothetical protein BOV90_08675 [Solemya velum gill symbiont]OOY42251.1 hypothetical protein BOV91_07590 [Solemya velum gill symbiont]OOY43058.1 hypothetical protein BOV92_12200 [Solemya velum gill symbiont]